jgi:tRNA dimethylallyltransferase
MENKLLVCILGPTAVGKTAATITLAKYFNTEILSADSRQFYKEITIGTAKPSNVELASIPHHFVGHKSIKETYTAGDFEKDALQLLDALFKKYSIVFAVGGSGLYVKALMQGLDDLPKANEPLRLELNTLYQTEGIEALQKRLLNLNTNLYQQTEINNPQRMMRAIEIADGLLAGFVPKTNKIIRHFTVLPVVLNLPRNELYQRINTRVDEMMQNGLLAEALNVEQFKHTYALKTVGYTELYDYLDGKYTLEQAVELIKQHSRNFAKRQLTWFKKEAPQYWFLPHQIDETIALVKKNTDSQMVNFNNT